MGAKIKGIPKGIPLIFFSHSRTERMIFHEVKGRCESVCTNVHTCQLRSRATQCRESSISARQRTCTNSIKADFCSLFCFSDIFTLDSNRSSTAMLAERARIFALWQNRSMPCKARHCGSQNSRDTVRRPSFFFPIIYFGFYFGFFRIIYDWTVLYL